MAEPDTAPAPLTASWSAAALDAGKVHDELERLWREWATAQRPSNGDAAAMAEFPRMRASTLNLIVVAERVESAKVVEQTVAGLVEYSPSRTVILVRDGLKKKGLGVRVSVHERSLGKGQPAIRFEHVTVAARPGSDALLASVTAPLLVPELPDFLWVPSGALSENPLLDELLDLVDRLVVDSANLDEPGHELRFLAALTRRQPPTLKVTDAVWARLTPWRQLIAQFFDQAATMPCLETIDEAVIEYGERDEDGRSGLTAGLLMAGWLASRLGWRAPGELVTSKDGWRLTLRSGKPGKGREVILRLQPTTDRNARCCLGKVTLVAGEDAPGEFAVERTTDQGITTSSETPTMPRVSRLVYGKLPDDGDLLGQELRNFSGDPVYEEALAFAAELWPNG